MKVNWGITQKEKYSRDILAEYNDKRKYFLDMK